MVEMLDKGWIDPSVVSEAAAATRVREHSRIWRISQVQVDWIDQVFAPAPPAARDRLHVPSKAGCFRRCGHRALDRASLHQGRTTQAWERNRPLYRRERQLHQGLPLVFDESLHHPQTVRVIHGIHCGHRLLVRAAAPFYFVRVQPVPLRSGRSAPWHTGKKHRMRFIKNGIPLTHAEV